MKSARAFSRSFLLLGLAGGALLPVRLLGYGHEGHEIVGAVADVRLAHTAAQTRLDAIVPGMTLQELAPVPDSIRTWDNLKATEKALPKVADVDAATKQKIAGFLPDAIRQQLWEYFQANLVEEKGQPRHHVFHFDDLALADGVPLKYQDDAIGAGRVDLVHTLVYCFQVLHGDAAAADPLKRRITPAIAVILLAHMMGDLHQPLHVGAEYFQINGGKVSFVDPAKTAYKVDLGGNIIAVRAPAEDKKKGITAGAPLIPGTQQENLHAVWDDDTVDRAVALWRTQYGLAKNSTPAALAAKLAKSAPPAAWLPDPKLGADAWVRGWATEILPLAREAHTRLTFVPYPTGVPNPKNRPIAIGGNPSDYLGWAAVQVQDEITRGGYRLAWLLQQALTDSASHK
ncbi:MAG TPA: S1/P1 nuclease [Opitutaceae bacterium]|nr:S1/P1 nuclease [Opitutaceae bacterium]